jgi:hypothetical protein
MTVDIPHIVVQYLMRLFKTVKLAGTLYPLIVTAARYTIDVTQLTNRVLVCLPLNVNAELKMQENAEEIM